MFNVKNILIFLLLLLVGVGCGYSTPKDNVIKMPSGKKVQVDVARTANEQAVGLSGREDINGGMLFCFNESKIQSFWMLGMLVPLDMVWIQDGVVVGISDRVPVKEMGKIARRKSPKDVNAVLELKSGSAEKFKIVKGSKLNGVVDICGR